MKKEDLKRKSEQVLLCTGYTVYPGPRVPGVTTSRIHFGTLCVRGHGCGCTLFFARYHVHIRTQVHAAGTLFHSKALK